MTDLFATIRALVKGGDYKISLHGSREIAADKLSLPDIVAGIEGAITLEEYPDTGRGPSVLVLQREPDGAPLHIVWGIHTGTEAPAVLVTAYRPDPRRWSPDFRVRRRS